MFAHMESHFKKYNKKTKNKQEGMSEKKNFPGR